MTLKGNSLSHNMPTHPMVGTFFMEQIYDGPDGGYLVPPEYASAIRCAMNERDSARPNRTFMPRLSRMPSTPTMPRIGRP